MAGDSNVVSGLAARLAFAVDIVGFGRRDAAGRTALRQRLTTVIDRVLADLGVQGDRTENDATVVCLPADVASAHVLPRLVSAMTERLSRDNQHHHDRMRLRMVVGTGDVDHLVDCAVLRGAITDDERSNLAVLVTQSLHDEVMRTGYLDTQDFTEVEVSTDELTATAWLRLC